MDNFDINNRPTGTGSLATRSGQNQNSVSDLDSMLADSFQPPQNTDPPEAGPADPGAAQFPPDARPIPPGPPILPPVTDDNISMNLLNTYVWQIGRAEAIMAVTFLITDEQLSNALKAVTGLDPNDSRITAIKDFAAYIIKTNQENDAWHGGYADVNGDGITNAKDLIQVYQTGRFDPPAPIDPPVPPQSKTLNDLNVIDKYIKDPHWLFTKRMDSGVDLFKALSTLTGLEVTNENRSAIYDFFHYLSENKSADVDGDKDTDIFDAIKVFQNGGFVPNGAVQPIDFGLGERNKEANKIRNKIFETIIPNLKEGVSVEELQPAIDMFLRGTVTRHLTVQGIAPPDIQRLLERISNLTNQEGQNELLQKVESLANKFVTAFPPKAWDGDGPPPPSVFPSETTGSTAPAFGGPTEVLPPNVSGILNSLDWIDRFIKHPGTILDQPDQTQTKGNAGCFWNPKAILFNALKEVTGVEFTKEREEAVIKFLEHLKENKSADVDGDKDTDIFDIFKVYQSGVFKPGGIDDTPPDPESPEEILKGIITQAKETAMGNPPDNPTPIEDVYTALEAFTGVKATDRKKRAVKRFLDALSHNRPADVDGKGSTNIDDLIHVWKKGRFRPIAYNPVGNGNNQNGINIEPINFGVGPYGITEEENQKANELRLQLYKIITPLLKDGLTKELFEKFDTAIKTFVTGSPGPVQIDDPSFLNLLTDNAKESISPETITQLRDIIEQFPEAKVQME